MEAVRFDRIARRLADRRLSRRHTLKTGGAGLAAGTLAATGFSATTSGRDAVPEPASDHGPTMLFVQSYGSGSITPVEGVEGRYTLTLEQGHGQTIYFSDRPDRIAGAAPTPQFLEGLGFPDDNPPNAALVIETSPGETGVAVVELFNPRYDPVSLGVTYEVEVLGNWRAALEMDFTETPTDPAALAANFGSAHLFIDDCPDGDILCRSAMGIEGRFPNAVHDGYCYSWRQWTCLPCQPWYDDINQLLTYWTRRCNEAFPLCEGGCVPSQLCSTGGVRRCQLT